MQEAAKLGGADETMVLVTDKVEATLRWAGNSMTTNGVSVSRSTTVISVVRQGDSASDRHGGLGGSGPAGDSRSGGGVARTRPARRRKPATPPRCWPMPGAPADWDAPVPGTGPEVFADVAAP